MSSAINNKLNHLNDHYSSEEPILLYISNFFNKWNISRQLLLVFYVSYVTTTDSYDMTC